MVSFETCILLSLNSKWISAVLEQPAAFDYYIYDTHLQFVCSYITYITKYIKI
jgi:hypothetical protein